MNTQKLIEAVEAVVTPDNVRLGHTWLKRKIREAIREYAEKEVAVDADEVESAVVGDLLANITDRRGFRQIWESCDDSIQDEIRASLSSILRPYLRTQCEAAKPTAQVSEAITKIVESADEEEPSQYKLVFIVGVQSFNIGYTSDDRREVEQLEKMFLKAIQRLRWSI